MQKALNSLNPDTKISSCISCDAPNVHLVSSGVKANSGKGFRV